MFLYVYHWTGYGVFPELRIKFSWKNLFVKYDMVKDRAHEKERVLRPSMFFCLDLLGIQEIQVIILFRPFEPFQYYT